VITETRLPAAFPSRVGRPAIRCFIDLAVHPHFASDSAFFASQGRKLYFFTTLYVDVKERALGSIESRRVGEALTEALRPRFASPAHDDSRSAGSRCLGLPGFPLRTPARSKNGV
jgi:hypothetical protein